MNDAEKLMARFADKREANKKAREEKERRIKNKEEPRQMSIGIVDAKTHDMVSRILFHYMIDTENQISRKDLFVMMVEDYYKKYVDENYKDGDKIEKPTIKKEILAKYNPEDYPIVELPDNDDEDWIIKL